MTADDATHRRPRPSPRRIRDRAAETPQRIAMREKDFGIWQEIDLGRLLGHGPDGRPRAARPRRRARRPGRHPLREPARVAVSPTWARVAVRAATRRPLPDQPGRRGRLPAVALRREGARRRGPGAGRQGARASSTTAPTWSRSSTSSRAGIRHRYDHPRLMSWEELLDARARRTASGTPTRSTERMARRRARRHRHPDLHLGHHRAAQGRDALGRQRRVRHRRPRRRRRRSPTRRPARDDLLLSYLPLCHVAERIFTHLVQRRPPALRSTSPSRSRPCRRTCARCSRRSSSASRGSGRSCSPASRSGSPAPPGSSAPTPGSGSASPTGSATTLVANGGQPHRRHPAALRASAGCSSSARCEERLGMRRVRYAASGAAPIAPDVLRVLHGHRRADARGLRHDREHRRRHRQPAGPGPSSAPSARRTTASSCGSTRRPARSSPGTPGTFVGYWRDPEATAAAR